MKVFSTHSEMTPYVANLKQQKHRIGFVPTMGALHLGHLSLLNRAKKENDIAICSIFVNPTQFNSKADLENYPRNADKDIAMFEKAGCDVVYLPGIEDVYPSGPAVETFDFGELDQVMEGKHRPGHFQGMATVVKRLFQLTQPDSAYFGEKDFQQLTIIRKLVELEAFPINIVGCATERELDGLAMSSRNVRLTPQQRHAAPAILESLVSLKEMVGVKNLNKAKAKAIELINAHPVLAVEYLEIADADTLAPLANWEDAKHAHAFAAVFAGDVRLIDNISLF
jgi:pantoate--beta-alanine ligase